MASGTEDAGSATRHERLAQRNFLDELLALRDRQRQARDSAEAVLRYEDLPWELNRQGLMRWYMAPTMEDTILNTFMAYIQRIPTGSRSGKQLVQGNQLGFVWKGSRGYSVIDEVRHEWGRWDLIQIPLRVRGCVVQHFNDGDDDIEIMFVSPNTAFSASVDRGSGFEQLEDCPEYRAARR